MHAVYQAVSGLTLAEARKYMDFVSPSLQGGGQFRHMYRNASDRNRVQTLPGKKSYSHLLVFR
jgi:hypothetical protein